MVKITLTGPDGLALELELSLEELEQARQVALGMADELCGLSKRGVLRYDAGMFAVMLLAQEMMVARSKGDQVLFQEEHL